MSTQTQGWTELPKLAGLPAAALALAGGAALALAGPVQAQREGEAGRGIVVLEEWVVVGTRTPWPVGAQAPAVGLLPAATVAERQLADMAGVLEALPGFYLATAGQEGAQVSLFTRGTNSDHTTILFEGRRLPAGFSGMYGIGALDLDPGLAVEAARGPASFLYGADAIGGVVNLRSEVRPGAASAGRGTVEGQGGSFGSWGVRGRAVVVDGNWTAEVAGGWRETDNDQPNAGVERRQGRLALWGDLGRSGQVDVQVLGWSSEMGLPDSRKADGYPKLDDYQKEHGWLVSPGWRNRFGDTAVAVFATRAEDMLEARSTFVFGGAPFVSHERYRTRTHAVEVQVDHDFGATLKGSLGVVAAETDFREADLLAGGVQTVEETSGHRGAWAQVQAELAPDLRVSAGLRVDDYDDYDTPVTGSVQVAWRPRQDFGLFARFGTAYAAPQAFDLYGQFGNPTLAAERSRSVEVGVRFLWGRSGSRGRVEATVFHQPIRDLIMYDPVTFTTANIGRALTEGVELAWEQDWGGHWTLYGHYTYLTAEDQDQAVRLLRRPRHIAFAGLRWRHARGSLALEARHVAGREDADAGTFARVDGEDYTVVRLVAQVRLADGWTVFGRIENLLDERYDEVDGYAALGRGAHLGVRYEW